MTYSKLILLLTIIALLLILQSCESAEAKKKQITPLVIDKIEKKVVNKKHIKKAKELDKFFNRRRKIAGFSGAVLFADHGEVVYKHAFGYANHKLKTELSTKTKFQIASVSKPFTSYAILLLKQRGELTLEDSVQKYFPKFPYKGVTIKLLLIHKSGIPEYNYFSDKYWIDRKTTITNDDVLNLMADNEISRYYLPNRKYNYINTNYAVLASIVEKVSGDSFEDFMMEEIFEPLGMNDSFVYRRGSEITTDNIAIGYRSRRRKIQDHYQNGVVGDKGVYTTVEDLLEFDKALYNGKLVTKENIESAFKPAHKRLYVHDNYGLGWRINGKDSTNKIVYHTGWWKGFRSYFIRQLGTKKTIIVLSNVANQSVFGTNELIKLL
ncbi:MAG: beta-lactamase family protein [Ignavibacteriae bacterium]|nr:beta-lactamase family protein [Ignavibacteriota bacterium]